MCHGQASARFPEPETGTPFDEGGLHGYAFGSPSAPPVAILPDIYGCNAFYRGLATHFAVKGLRVLLMDPFHAQGPLAEATREAAFERRHKVRDGDYMDALVGFLSQRAVGGVIGFCLGGLYVFDLVRRKYAGNLVAFYPFPQGLPNQDPLPVPFDYLGAAATPHTVLIGDTDPSLGPDNTRRLEQIAAGNGALDLHVYAGSGHGFLGDLDSADPVLRANAEAGLAVAEAAFQTQFA